MKQDRHPIDFDTAGSGEMALLALVLGLEGPLLTTIMLKQGASLVMALGILVLPVAIIAPLVGVLWRGWSSRWPFEALREDAQVQTMQSLAGFNRCVRLATDCYGVHATLNRPFRWLLGEPFSIPWSELQWEAQGAFAKFTDTRKGSVGGRSLTFPNWVHEAAQHHSS